ncbi:MULTISPECIES: hypothetical protein [unclassified Rhodococcus (in: high G+C Gram-positive bacteria)]|uniref:hypothetical protein n=1 Tax=unclassified Rhodococcus (in: high G+C Gram-positive bacteria) TaxID=192944 RepID=UPI0021BFD5DB|nr:MULTISPECIES: hypothetical protein [unclassified Rhodococcus (in: high G+C Gram-positive bacteria)]
METENRFDTAGTSLQHVESDRFDVEEITTGSHANGFGRTDDGRPFAFRVHRGTLYLAVYRANMSSAVPDESDVSAVAEQSMTEVDIADERSVVAAVRDAVNHATPVDPSTSESSPMRSLLGRMSSLIDVG